MKKLLSILLPSLLLICIILAFKYNDDPLDALLARLAKLTGEYPQEKVYLQFDKPYYSLSEDIWFKAYVVNAGRNYLSNASKVLYVDLLDERDSVRKTLLLPLINGTTNANIHLSDSILNAGNYHVYAYTKWMINFGSDYFFKKNIAVVNALQGSITANIKYKASVNTTGKQLSAEILFKNNDNPIISQPVIYKLQAKGKVIAEGKAITGVDGSVAINSLVKEEYKTADILVNATINITSPLKDTHSFTQEFVIKPLASTADVQFFPEGGKLVSNIRTKVGFKVLKINGLGEHISGYITDEGNEHVAEFQSEHAGMGVFALQPLTGKTYTAVIKHEDGSEKRYPLPVAEATGYVLNVNHVGDSLSVRVSASPALMDGREVILVAQSNGIVQFAAKTKMDRASNLSYLATKKFQTGITQFTLFSPDYLPVAERLVFIDHNDQLGAVVKPDKDSYTKRGKVNMGITVADALGEPVVGSFSVAVTNADKVKVEENNETTVMSSLLLTSDIKGYIEQPNYYFNTQNTDRQKHLDQLLLTQGWRRFNWADLQANKFPKLIYPHEEGLTVTGTITTIGGKPISKGKVTLFASTANGPILVDTVADENGRYVFNDLNFADSAKIVVRATNAKNSTIVKTTIDKKTHVLYKASFDAGAVTDESLANYLKFTQTRFNELSKFGLLKNATALKEVKIVSKKNYFADHVIPNSSNLSPGSADQVIKPDKLERETNLLYAFYGLPGIEVKNDMVYRVGRIASITRPGGVPMMVIVDGATIDASMLKEIPPGSVAGVELLTSGSNVSVYGNDGAWGVILITTKRGGGFSINNSFNVVHHTPDGYATIKQFYSPLYDNPADQSKMVDLRSTVYWNPDVITDATGKATFSYFNTDEPGTYKVTLEGMDLKGKLLRKTYTYTVK